MCEYCAYNSNFWNDIIERSKDIRILTPEEVEEVEELYSE